MSQTVRMAYSDSNLTYGGDTIHNKFRHFMMRIFQINGSAPQIWSIISYVVFLALQSQVFGIHFEDSFIIEISDLVGFSYLDKCDMVQSYNDVEATISKMQLVMS